MSKGEETRKNDTKERKKGEKMTENEVRKVINGQRWVFAKSYAAFAPHEYIIRGKCNLSDSDFDKFCDYINENGIPMYYYKYKRKYLFIDGYFYWLMGEIENPDHGIVNRCRPEDYDIVFMKRGTQRKKYEQPEQLRLPLDEMR